MNYPTHRRSQKRAEPKPPQDQLQAERLNEKSRVAKMKKILKARRAA